MLCSGACPAGASAGVAVVADTPVPMLAPEAPWASSPRRMVVKSSENPFGAAAKGVEGNRQHSKKKQRPAQKMPVTLVGCVCMPCAVFAVRVHGEDARDYLPITKPFGQKRQDMRPVKGNLARLERSRGLGCRAVAVAARRSGLQKSQGCCPTRSNAACTDSSPWPEC